MTLINNNLKSMIVAKGVRTLGEANIEDILYLIFACRS